MTVLQQGKATGCYDPVLVHHVLDNGFLVDLHSLEFVVYDMSTIATLTNPVQVFPLAGRQSVNTDLCSNGGHKLSTGRYVAEYTPDANANPGEYLIRWYEVRTVGGPEVVYDQVFQIVPDSEPVLPNSYCSISELRSHGFSECQVSDYQLAKAAIRATSVIHKITKRTFGAVYKTITVDGKNSESILLDEAIIALESVVANDTITYLPEELKVYNRHISQNLMAPDDRNSPKVAFRQYLDYPFTHQSLGVPCPRKFPRGNQNLALTGIFGYTEYDGSPVGSVPNDIKKVCAMLVTRELPLIGTGDRQLSNQAFRITLERTRHQTIEYASPTGVAQTMVFGTLTGDPEIDSILAAYMRPIAVGVV